MIYIYVRNSKYNEDQAKLAGIDPTSSDYNDLLSLFQENFLIYENIDGIVTIIAFFSFIHYLSKVSRILRCYFEMLIKVLLSMKNR